MTMYPEHMTKDGQGYVYWKGAVVEHFSYEDPEKERAAAEAMAKRCRHLEAIGVPVNGRTTVWFYSWFEAMNANHAHKALLSRTPDFIEHPERGLAYTRRASAGEFDASVLIVWNGNAWAEEETVVERRAGEGVYHALVAKGWGIAKAGQREDLGVCYANLAGVEALLARHGVGGNA